MQFIDMHGHYAWGIDDGLQDLESAKKALQKAKENRITAIVATPHLVCGDHDEKHIETLKSRIREFKELAKQYQINVFEGSELFLNDQLHHQLDQNLVIPIENTKYMLCEFDVRKDMSDDPEDFEDLLYEVIVKGYTPIVAHVERYFKSEIDIDRILDLIDMGCVIQINSSSLLHRRNKYAYNNAKNLLDNNCVHIIASDTHDYTGNRCPNLLEVYDLLSKQYHKSDLDLLFYKNQLAILKNEEVTDTNIKPKGIFGKLFKRRS